MKVDVRPRHRNAPRAAWRVAASYLAWLRGRACAADGYGLCDGRIEAAHVDHAGGKGTGLKVADRHCLPLCSEHHARQHRRGWKTFEVECLGGKSAIAMADAYWRAWPGRYAWEAEREG